MADAYRDFLSLIGGGAGRFMQGEDVYHPDVLGLGTAARELLEENESPFHFEPTDRVFPVAVSVSCPISPACSGVRDFAPSQRHTGPAATLGVVGGTKVAQGY
ncbi:hypothetical protein HEP87_49730 [Streptomyces sp. S1D4-11]|nr:hypothetical protein [Streptomyces sp. S1D4-11]QIZ00421.1 hypothetical protein HEP87_49730 [Streptomyces sp. S1D4-11]